MYELYVGLASFLRDPLTMIFLFVGLLGLCAYFATLCFRRAAERRNIWLAHYLILALFLGFEITGFGASWQWINPITASSTENSTLPAMAEPSKVPVTEHPGQRPDPWEHSGREVLSLERLLLVSWAVGTAVLWGRIAFAHLLLIFLRTQLKPLTDQRLLERITALSRKVGMRRPLAVRESSRLASPMIFGVLRPTLIIPRQFMSLLEPQEQDAVLIHEFMHIRSNDSFWSVFAEAVTALAWWHPLIWWAEISFAREMESAADEASLNLNDQGPVWLAEAILKLGTEALWATSPPALAIAGPGGKSTLENRVKNLLSLKPFPFSPIPSFCCAVLVPAFMAIAGIALAAGARPLVAEESAMFRSDGVANCWRHSLAGSLMALLMGPSSVPASTISNEAEEPGSVAPQDPKTDDQTAKPTYRVFQPVSLAWVRLPDKTEEASAEYACFSKEQKTAFTALLKECEKRTKEFHELKGGAPEEGIKINKWYNEELKKIISPRQYQLYVEYWNDAKASPSRTMKPRPAQPKEKEGKKEEKEEKNKEDSKKTSSAAALSRAPDFGSMEDKILAELDLSQTQKEEVAKAREQLAKENQAYKEMVKQGDANEIAKKAGEINRLARSSMQKIMTKTQYAKYVSLWDAALGIKKSVGGAWLGTPAAPATRN